MAFAPISQTPSTATRMGATCFNSTAPKFLLEEERFKELRRNEQALLIQRHIGRTRRKLTQSAKKKKKSKTVNDTLPLLPNGLFVKTLYKLDSLSKWQQDARLARATVEEWMERFRLNRYSYWQERHQQYKGEVRECLQCKIGNCCEAVDDELMQCLECSFVGCGPISLTEESSQHMMHHMLRSGHCFGMYKTNAGNFIDARLLIIVN
jgi:hypothetical protein